MRFIILFFLFFNIINFVKNSECDILSIKNCHQSDFESKNHSNEQSIKKEINHDKLQFLSLDSIETDECQDCGTCHAHKYTVIFPMKFEISPLEIKVASKPKFFEKTFLPKFNQPPIS